MEEKPEIKARKGQIAAGKEDSWNLNTNQYFWMRQSNI